jgi:hypothetical protein
VASGGYELGQASSQVGDKGEGDAKGESSRTGPHEPCNVFHDQAGTGGSTGRERVSFGTNMSTEEESSDGRSVEQEDPTLMTAIQRFDVKKFRGKEGAVLDKGVVLKVIGGGSHEK